MAEAKHPAKSRKIVDVARPGKSAPSPNSRSVIISHRPIMRDPMMSADLPEAAQDEAAPTAPAAATSVATTRASGAVIQPLADSTLTTDKEETPEEAAPTTEEAPTAETDGDETPSEPVTETETEPAVAEAAPAEEPENNDEKPTRATRSTGTDAKLGTKDVKSDVEIAAAEDAEAKRKAALQEMIETKKYYLPINTVEKRRTKQFVAGGVLLSLLLIVAWADIAMDAGLIKIGHLHALTHFFN